MIIGISVKNFKSIKSIENLYLDRFHVLVGANASGKSTFLDVFEFVKDCVSVGPLEAAFKRGITEFRDLTYMRQGGKIEFDFWFDIDSYNLSSINSIINYHLCICVDDLLGVCIDNEILRRYSKADLQKGKYFEFSPNASCTDLLGKIFSTEIRTFRAGISRVGDSLSSEISKQTDFFLREDNLKNETFSFGLGKCALESVQADYERYPTANIIKLLMTNGIKYIQLNSQLMRFPCPAFSPTQLKLNGDNLAKVVGQLITDDKSLIGTTREKEFNGKEILQNWTDHLRYAIDDLTEINWGKREADNAEYIILKYENGLECPSWLLSDGTLRMMALTLLAFLPASSGVYMVEEPENGVHPKALEIIIQSLSHVPGAQVLVASHSPLVVQQVGKNCLLCFSRDDENGTKIQPGSNHPALEDWDGTPDLATYFAMGVLE